MGLKGRLPLFRVDVPALLGYVTGSVELPENGRLGPVRDLRRRPFDDVHDLIVAFAGEVAQVRNLKSRWEGITYVFEPWRPGAANSDNAARARRVADYIAGMTDRFAQEEHGKLLGRDGKN